jgi:hypothetical protein
MSSTDRIKSGPTKPTKQENKQNKTKKTTNKQQLNIQTTENRKENCDC